MKKLMKKLLPGIAALGLCFGATSALANGDSGNWTKTFLLKGGMTLTHTPNGFSLNGGQLQESIDLQQIFDVLSQIRPVLEPLSGACVNRLFPQDSEAADIQALVCSQLLDIVPEGYDD